NAQMRVRHLQQQQLEAFCRELGMPTRSEVTALGKQLHELRRELRGGAKQAAAKQPQTGSDTADETAGLRAEIAALKRQLAQGSPKAKKPAATAPAKKAAASSAKNQVTKSAPSKTPVRKASSRKPVTKTAARTAARRK
ncbi:poly(R)-hydroxyalkanoic acid synthase subunit PhaE, partial [Dyella silvatica]|uniref:poly(R)-hydroxyalkanoic acid synthase subunit PhaE n=1 Tax=Dyella silvatica TaxID=2992128 RepID=UPI002B1CD4BB